MSPRTRPNDGPEDHLDDGPEGAGRQERGQGHGARHDVVPARHTYCATSISRDCAASISRSSRRASTI